MSRQRLDTPQSGNRAQRIAQALRQAFQPETLEVIDESAFHAGHSGARPEGETHFRVKIAAQVFSGAPRVAVHRQINQALAAEFDAGLHALAIEAGGPPEG